MSFYSSDLKIKEPSSYLIIGMLVKDAVQIPLHSISLTNINLLSECWQFLFTQNVAGDWFYGPMGEFPGHKGLRAGCEVKFPVMHPGLIPVAGT
jgi:hypothetical protein